MKNQCPNCSHYKLEPRWGRPVAAFLSVTVVGIPLMLILIGFVLVPIGIVGMILSWLLLKGERCTNCGWSSKSGPERGKNASPRY